MSAHFIAVFKKFFLLSDHRDMRADSQLANYIGWYEWVARTGWFVTISLLGLGIASQGKLAEQAIKAVTNVRNDLGQFVPEMSNLAAPFLSNPAGILLAVITVGWHNAYLRHVKNETEIVKSCFEKDQKPEWDEISGAKFAPFIGAWLFLAFTGLCLTVGHVKWYALVAIILNLGDFAGNEFTKNNLLKVFRSKDFRTRDKTLLERRRIALEYWSEKWQFTRILMMFMFNVLALSAASGVFGIQTPDYVSYALVAIAIVVNEYIITTWRIERDHALHEFPVAGSEHPTAGRAEQRPAAPKRGTRKKRSPDAGE